MQTPAGFPQKGSAVNASTIISGSVFIESSSPTCDLDRHDRTALGLMGTSAFERIESRVTRPSHSVGFDVQSQAEPNNRHTLFRYFFKIMKTNINKITIYTVGYLLVFAANCCAWQGKVVGISDGDTIKVLHDGKLEKIRLYGVDTPEKSQAFGQKAKEFTAAMTGPYHGNTKSKVFHSASCKHYTCKACTAGFKTRDEALKASYRA